MKFLVQLERAFHFLHFDRSHDVFLFQEKGKMFIYFRGQFTVTYMYVIHSTYVIDRLFGVY